MRLFTLGAAGVMILGLTCCEDRYGPNTDRSPTAGDAATTPPNASAPPVAPDNTGINERDDGATLTPEDQGASASDTELTQRIRQAVVAADGLSMNGQNIKIITVNGQVTLRGPVASAEEKARIVAMAEDIAGAPNVDDQLEAP